MFEKVVELEEKNIPFAIVTIAEYSGIVSRKSGRMIVTLSGETYGTIGGGWHEREAVNKAIECIKRGENALFDIKVKNSGSISVMVDVVIKNRSVVIFGSGHVALECAKIFLYLSWRVTIIDDKVDFSKNEIFSRCKCLSFSFLDGLKNASIDSNTAIIILSPEDGNRYIKEIEKTDAFYIGILSSRKNSLSKIDERVFVPIGLSLGEVTPEEIAISISSEVLSLFNKKVVKHNREWKRRLTVIKGGGDLATGVALRLHNAGYNVVITETEKPTTIRRTVSFSEAIYEKSVTVSGVECKLVEKEGEIFTFLDKNIIPIMVDPMCKIIEQIKPNIVVDAIIAKKNLGTKIDDAPLTIALGPGFTAGEDVNVVIETMRGHNLGKIIRKGSAFPNTGIPGIIDGKGAERVLHSPCNGTFYGVKQIGDIVKKGEVIAKVGSMEVKATIDGKLRGLLHDKLIIPEGFKIADIDPRGVKADHLTPSDKAYAVSGAVLEVVDSFINGIK